MRFDHVTARAMSGIREYRINGDLFRYDVTTSTADEIHSFAARR